MFQVLRYFKTWGIVGRLAHVVAEMGGKTSPVQNLTKATFRWPDSVAAKSLYLHCSYSDVSFLFVNNCPIVD